jgi:hypothetical protein
MPMGRTRQAIEKTPGQLQARELYVKRGMNPQDIAKVVKGASESSIWRWRAKFRWEKARMEWLKIPFTAGEKLRTEIAHYTQLMHESKTAEEAQHASDGLAKLVSVIHKLDDESNRRGAILWAVSKLQVFIQHELRTGTVSQEICSEISNMLERFSLHVTESQS